jgi:hypothetical protein
VCWCNEKIEDQFCGRPGCRYPPTGNHAAAVRVTRKENDARGFCRVNAGGRPDSGFYVVFKGSLHQAVMTTRHVLAALEDLERGIEHVCDRCRHL